MARDEYETECQRVGIALLSDDEIATKDRRGWYDSGYALPQFERSEATLTAYLRSVLDSARSWGLRVEAGRYAVEVTPNRDPEMVPSVRYVPAKRPSVAQTMPDTWGACSLCGMSVNRRMLMTSPKGEVCPDCYDEAEA